jgi:uncharacterized surface protein with fasciclin (FAS1) repeats
MKRKFAAGVAAALAAATLAGTIGTGTAGAATPMEMSIADVLLADDAASGQPNVLDRNWRDYDIVTAAVLLNADLVAAASNKSASLTVLAPNDNAFRLLASAITNKRYSTEAAVVTDLLAYEAANPGTLKAILTYHIVGAKLGPTQVLASDNAQVSTLGGGTFAVDVINPRVAFVQFVDGDPDARNPFLNRINVGGGELANGYIHGIDRVLRPIDL